MCSAWVGGVGDEFAADAAGVVVECDLGGERERSLADARAQAVQGAGGLAFEGQPVFAGPEDAFDALADGVHVQAAFVLAARAVEVGEHRGRLGSTARISTAFVDLLRYVPSHPTGTAPVELRSS